MFTGSVHSIKNVCTVNKAADNGQMPLGDHEAAQAIPIRAYFKTFQLPAYTRYP